MASRSERTTVGLRSVADATGGAGESAGAADAADVAEVAVEVTREDLLMRVASGDHDAFSELYSRVVSRVFTVVQRSLLDHAQAEEVTQDVLLEVWQYAPRFDPYQGSALTWILTIAHHRAVDRVRSAQSSRTRDLRSGIRHLDVAYDNVWESTEIRLEHERAERAMLTLSPLQREAIALTYFDGYTQVELAGMLGVSIGTAKTRVRDGLLRLRREMEVIHVRFTDGVIHSQPDTFTARG